MAAAAARQRFQERNSRHRGPRSEESAWRDPRPHRDADGADRRRLFQGECHRPGRTYPRRHPAPDLDGRSSDFGCDGRRLRHHHSPRAGRYRGPRQRGRRCQPAFGREQATDHHGVGAAEFRHDVRCRPDAGGDRQPRQQRHQIQSDRRQDRGGGNTRAEHHHHPHRRRGRRAVPRRSRPIVRPFPAAVRKAHRRRKFDRPRAFNRQAHHRYAWRPGHCEQPGARTGLDLHRHLACNRDFMTQSPHIIIVDDEAPAREMVGEYLKMHGFTVTLCDGGRSLRGAIETSVPDLVVLDLNMPEEDGLSIIRDLKSRTNVPVIMLTATASPIDRVVGLELGADDYIAKPCELRELMARIRSVLRRSSPAKTPAATPAAKAAKDQLVRFGTKWLDLEAQALRDDEGNEHPLTASEFSLLKVFAANPKRVLSRERLLELANARDAEAFDRAVDLRIMRIRRKIEPDPAKPAVIRTIRGGGYLFSPVSDKT